MPYTSYTSYNYTNYGNSRPYTGSKTYLSFMPTSSYSPTTLSTSNYGNYGISSSATTMYVPSYKISSSNYGSTGNHNLPSAPYVKGLKSSISSNTLSNYDTAAATALGSRNRVSAAPKFLSGNTASLRKAFGDREHNSGGSDKSDVSAGLPGLSSGLSNYRTAAIVGRRFNVLDDGKKPLASTEKKPATTISSYLPPPAMGYNRGVNTSSYMSKFGLFDDPPKPKEIDSTKINYTSRPPPRPPTTNSSVDQGDIKRNDAGTISRNRQVVRLTIKRNRLEEKDPHEVKRNSIKTVAQKLLDKYTISETKKPTSNDKLCYGPRDRHYNSSSQSEKHNSKNNTGNCTTANPNSVVSAHIAGETSKEDETSDSSDVSSSSDTSDSDSDDVDNTYVKQQIHQHNHSTNSKRGLSKTGAELEDSLIVFSRASENAAQKADLESAQEVKDIILAASLHPDIDIESDEEIRQLIDADSGESLPNTPDISVSRGNWEKNLASSGRKINPVECITTKHRKLIDLSLNDGTLIVDKLKRFVKKQESIKKASVKRLSKSSKTKDCIDKSSIITVKFEGRLNSPTEKRTVNFHNEPSNIRDLKEKSENNNTNKNFDFLCPLNQPREQERFFKKSPTSQLALREGMEKIKLSIAVCDNICKDDNSGSNGSSKRNSFSRLSSDSLRSSDSSCNSNSFSPVIGNLILGVKSSEKLTNTCLEDAPWRKKRSPIINKSKTSVNILNSLSSSSTHLPNHSSSLAKSTSTLSFNKPTASLDDRLDTAPADNKSRLAKSTSTFSFSKPIASLDDRLDDSPTDTELYPKWVGGINSPLTSNYQIESKKDFANSVWILLNPTRYKFQIR